MGIYNKASPGETGEPCCCNLFNLYKKMDSARFAAEIMYCTKIHKSANRGK